MAPAAAAQGGGAWGDFPDNTADAARFLEYSTWGPNSTNIGSLQQIGYGRFLEEQFAATPSSYPTLPLVPSTIPADCDATCRRNNYTLYPVQTHFYRSALYGQDQLRQRVAFALHQIIVVSGLEITHPSRITPYLQILDRNAFGNFRQLLHEITLNPAMGNYLDMAGNNAANPNENYAREVLQLFSIGLYQLNEDGTTVAGSGGPIPAYDQAVVNAFARVFTGWNFAAAPAPGIVNYLNPMVATASRHDTRAKVLLNGVTLPAGQTAAKDLSDALDNIFNHPNVGPFIGKQLIQHLVTSNPSPEYVRRVARVFADNGVGVRGDLKAVVRAILLDEEAAINPSSPQVPKGHLKHPVLMVTSLLRALNARSADGLSLSDGYLNPQNQNMGMDLFNPPSVFSYFSPATGVPGSSLKGPEFGVLNTSTAIRRANFVNTMVFSRVAVSANAPSGTSLDFSLIQPYANSPETMVLVMNTLMMSGRMSQAMADSIVAAVKAVPATNPLRRAQTAVYLIATSGQYQVSR
jgi:hypothetical protein